MFFKCSPFGIINMDKKNGIEIINSENICFRRQKFILACLKPVQQLSALEVPYKINSKEFVISVNIFANTFNSWEMFFFNGEKNDVHGSPVHSRMLHIYK